MEKENNIIIRLGRISKNSSMDNYYINSIMPVCEKLKDAGYNVIIQSSEKVNEYKYIKYLFPYRKGIFHIFGFLLDEFQLLNWMIKKKGKLIIFSIHQLLPTIFLRRKSIIIIHDIMPMEFPEFWPILSIYYRLYLKIMLVHAKQIISVSNTTKLKLIEYYKIQEEKIQVVYNGNKFGNINTIIKKTRMNNSKINLLYVGANLPNKNLKILVDAFVLLGENYVLNMVSGCCKNEYVKHIAKISNNINLLGYVDEDVLVNLYKDSDGLVYPSISEGFGLPLIEAMWFSLPVIVADRDYAREVCEGYPAVFFDPLDKFDLIEKVKQCNYYVSIDIDSLRANLRAKYSWDNTASEIFSIIVKG